MGGNILETLIGAVVLVIAGLFVAFAYSTTGGASGSGYALVARFDRVDGVAAGADVKLSGIKIGQVTSSTLDHKTFQAIVGLNIQQGIELPDDSSARITTEGLLGGTYIAIEPGGSDKNLAPGGEVRFTQGSIDLMTLIGHAVFGSSDKPGGNGAAPAPEGGLGETGLGAPAGAP
ncbi:outer membrane lipid asymmetry maintenance protein MlaD [Zavarzinia sp. CC-PAN008]|uniref:outer membrane lipid asymmetry maintenance protein MlaD n=1 Tax=Zavarzinia sp. CC-PAN008 TaxID=3243332 RepID=UPI003F745FF1